MSFLRFGTALVPAIFGAAFLAGGHPLRAQSTTAPLSAETIMARVAANQDRAEAERAHFVYLQHARIQSRKGGSVMCEETTEERVSPVPGGNLRSPLSLQGQVRQGDRVLHYTSPPLTLKQARAAGTTLPADASNGDKQVILDADHGNTPTVVDDTDTDLVDSLRRTFTSDKRNKDGIQAGLFPLTTAQQKDMAFTLKGREQRNGHDTFHITFRPRDHDDYGWKGDAWIDSTALQPVAVRTALSRSLPLGVRMLLGTNLPGLGFTVLYAPQGPGIWFPVSFGTEFKIRVLFIFERQMVVSVENHDFQQTHVDATVHTEAASPIPD